MSRKRSGRWATAIANEPSDSSQSGRSRPSRSADAIGADAQAHALFASVHFLRDEAGGYWTGANFDRGRFDQNGELYPVEQPTWNSAAVVLAANALGGAGPTAGLFRGEGLPAGLTADELIAAGEAIEAGRTR